MPPTLYIEPCLISQQPGFGPFRRCAEYEVGVDRVKWRVLGGQSAERGHPLAWRRGRSKAARNGIGEKRNQGRGGRAYGAAGGDILRRSGQKPSDVSNSA